MSAKSWRIVRLQVQTVADLRRLAADWQRLADQGRLVAPAGQHGITIDWIVRELVRRVKDHRKRGNRSNARHVYKKIGAKL